MMMDKLYIRLSIIILLLTGIKNAAMAQQQSPIIPYPYSCIRQAGDFILTEKTAIVAEGKQSAKAAYYLQNEILRSTGITLGLLSREQSSAINFNIVAAKVLNGNTYELNMSTSLIEIKAADEEGLFLGAVSFLQLVRQAANVNGHIKLANWSVQDRPFYNWRGLMLDESRHFFGKEKVKKLLDWMAFYKLNKFHWHLTDQQGWRIEIQKYPRLTLIGGVGNYSDTTAPAKFYTQEEIKEIVAYAADRFIEVIPEIDMPGHATASNLAYPEFSGGGSPKYPDFTFNPGKEKTYQFLTNVLKEVDVLFPSQKIHIGADEVHFGNQNWNVDADVQHLMKVKQIKDLKGVEYYFVKRMADSVTKMNNTILAWDEVLDAGLSTDKTLVFWWRHNKPEELRKSLEKGYKTILCPRLPLYFDFVQHETHTIGRKWINDVVSIDKVYNFPSQEILLLPNANKLVQGVQANIWTESVSTEQHLDFMLFPRITALAESGWANPKQKNYQQFQERLKIHLSLFAKAGLYYFDPFDPKKYPEFLGPMQRNKMTPSTDELTKQEQGN